MKKLILFLFCFGFSSQSQAASFNCDEQPGRKLCLDMRATASYIVVCDGSSCYPLWRNYISSMNRLTDFYLSYFLPNDDFSEQIGDLAYTLAQDICKLEIYGDREWVAAIVTAENRLLLNLREIQLNTNFPVVKFCEKSVE